MMRVYVDGFGESRGLLGIEYSKNVVPSFCAMPPSFPSENLSPVIRDPAFEMHDVPRMFFSSP
jgi:hypothetical protein